MDLKVCRVTISDMQGVVHTVEVTAASLYEAVALGLHQIRGNDWVDEIATGSNTVTIRTKSVEVEHSVTVAEFMKWLERTGGSPAEMSRRRKVREILNKL